jgi:hypothetical protein
MKAPAKQKVKSLCLLFFLFSSLAQSLTSTDSRLVGTWKYVGFIYADKPFPPLDSKLLLYLKFIENQGERQAELRWSSSDELGACVRRAKYEVRNQEWLYQKVYWVDPQNKSSCSSDPDMRLGSESTTHFRIQVENNTERLLLDLELNGEPLVYILEREAYLRRYQWP